MNNPIFIQADKIWKKATQNATLEELQFEVDLHKNLMNLFQVGEYYYYVMNLTESSIIYASNEIATVLGYDPRKFTLEFYVSIIHPEDQGYILNFEAKAAEFLGQLPVDKLLKYKVRYDLRVLKNDGSYIRILHQGIVVQHNSEGNIAVTIGVDTDITHIKTEGVPVLSFIGLDGEPSYIDVDVQRLFPVANEVLSKREKEVLFHIVRGKQTKEIGSLLNLSTQTVETHRKNMIKKTGTKNTAELVAQAIKKGWV